MLLVKFQVRAFMVQIEWQVTLYLEVVFAKKASTHILENFQTCEIVIPEWDISKVTETQKIIRHNWDEIRRLSGIMLG